MQTEMRYLNDSDIATYRKTSEIALYGMTFFTVAGIAFMYIYIFLLDIAMTQKVLFAGALTLTIAFIFMGMYTVAKESLRGAERQRSRKRLK